LQRWARNLTAEDVVEYIRSRVSSSMGFKDQVKKSVVVADGTGKRYRKSRRASAGVDPCQSQVPPACPCRQLQLDVKALPGDSIVGWP
jgi:hypothetical protein